MPVGNESFKSSDSYRFSVETLNTESFTLVFLRTNSSADSWKCTCIADDLISCFEISFSNLSNEFRDPYHYRTTLSARLLSALETSHSFIYCHLRCISFCHFFEVSCSYDRILLRHRILYLFQINHGNAHLLSDGKCEPHLLLPVPYRRNFS